MFAQYAVKLLAMATVLLVCHAEVKSSDKFLNGNNQSIIALLVKLKQD